MTGPGSDDLAAAVAAAAAQPELVAELASLYGEVDRAVADLGQRCDACGRCCRFSEFGHRLYVSTLELAMLVGGTRAGAAPLAEEPKPPPTQSADVGASPCGSTLDEHPGECPCQQGDLCTARDRRALGCRVFSCDPVAAAAEQDLYAHFHARIQHLHNDAGVPYYYADLADALRRLRHD